MSAVGAPGSEEGQVSRDACDAPAPLNPPSRFHIPGLGDPLARTTVSQNKRCVDLPVARLESEAPS